LHGLRGTLRLNCLRLLRCGRHARLGGRLCPGRRGGEHQSQNERREATKHRGNFRNSGRNSPAP
jgi:hypothetical protein